MRIGPEIKALRSDPAVQRQVAGRQMRALDQLRDDQTVNQVKTELARFSAGTMLHDLPTLSRIMRCHTAALDLVTRWNAPFLEALQEEPLVQIPFRHSYSGGFALLQLASTGNTALSLICYEHCHDEVRAEAANFADREQYEIVLAGFGQTQLHRICEEQAERAVIETSEVSLSPGAIISSESRQVSRNISGVKGRMVMLQLHRRPENPAPTRDYALSDGRLLHQASGAKRDSQCEMAMAVLGAMGRDDAVPAMLALSKNGSSHLRWEALRHALALETASGLERLTELAGDRADPLSAHAEKVRRHLYTTFPQFTEQEATPCPA